MSPYFNADTVKLFMALALFLSGLLTMGLGLLRLLTRELHTTMKSLALQSARIGQKAITEDIADIAESAAKLMDSLNDLIRTNAGIGSFLLIFGMVQTLAAYWIVTH